MRSHLKLSLILAAAIFPTVLHAEDKAIVPTSEDLVLNLDQAKSAFHEFQAGAGDQGKMAVLYGTTSTECMNAFRVTNDSSTGEFTITLPAGSDSNCLDYSKLSGVKAHTNLSNKDGAKMVFSATLLRVSLRGHDPKAARDREPDELFEGLSEESIAFISASDINKQKKADAQAKKEASVQGDYLLAVSCTHGLTELDLRTHAIDNLAKVNDFVHRGEIGAEWFKKIRKETDDKIFAACQLQVTRAKTDDFADCDGRLARLVDKDPELYGPKVRVLYMTMVNRYKNSTELAVNDAYDRAAAMIDILRGMDLEEDELKALDIAERDLLLAMLSRAAKEGDQTAYADMAEKFKGHLLDHNDLGCLDDDAQIFPAKRYSPACRNIGWMAAQLPQSRAVNVAMAQVNADRAARQELADREQLKYTSCQTIAEAGGASTAECKALDAKFTAAASAEANKGIVQNDGFAEAKSEAGIIAANAAVNNTSQGSLTAASTVVTPVTTVRVSR